MYGNKDVTKENLGVRELGVEMIRDNCGGSTNHYVGRNYDCQRDEN